MRLAGVALLLAAAFVAGCTSTGPPPAATPRDGWPVGVDSEAIGLAATPAGLIVVTAASTRHPPQVHRYDADGRQAARQAAVGNPNGLAVDPSGAAWVPATRHPDMTSGTGVPVLDPVSLRPRREIDAGGEPLTVAFPGDAAWIGLRNRIRVVDRATGRGVRTLPIPGTAYQLVPAGAVVDAVLDGALLALDARTGRVLARRAVDSAGSLNAALAGGTLWVGWLDEGRTRLAGFDPRTLAPARTGPMFGAEGVTLAAAGPRLWIADHDAGTLSCLDPSTGAVRTTVKVPNSSALAVDDRWAYLADDGLVRRVPAAC
ncbi:MAG TPA: hypothetical protein VF109_10690 [Mycobacteriales bacterium]